MKRSEKFINRTGEVHNTKEGYLISIISYRNNSDCDVKFENGIIVENKEYQELIRGSIKNPFHPSVCGRGYVGVGKYPLKIYIEIGKKWRSVLERSYSNDINRPTYKDVVACEEWHNFQNFAKWHEENFKPHMKDWHLDKDILIKGNKIYGPETCCFVPQEINTLLISCNSKRGDLPIGVARKGENYSATININKKQKWLGAFDTPEEAFEVYKVEKEIYIKQTAEKWKGKITDQVYQALLNYKVEITD